MNLSEDVLSLVEEFQQETGMYKQAIYEMALTYFLNSGEAEELRKNFQAAGLGKQG